MLEHTNMVIIGEKLLLGGDWNMAFICFYDFPFSWEFHHPN